MLNCRVSVLCYIAILFVHANLLLEQEEDLQWFDVHAIVEAFMLSDGRTNWQV